MFLQSTLSERFCIANNLPRSETGVVHVLKARLLGPSLACSPMNSNLSRLSRSFLDRPRQQRRADGGEREAAQHLMEQLRLEQPKLVPSS